MAEFDAIVVGAGPNGLTAAVTLAQAGLTVLVVEAADTAGGGARTEELTLPGFRHDPCAAAHPFAAGSPVLRNLALDRFGLSWVHPDIALAHPFPDGSAAVGSGSVLLACDRVGQFRLRHAGAAAHAEPGGAPHQLLLGAAVVIDSAE